MSFYVNEMMLFRRVKYKHQNEEGEAVAHQTYERTELENTYSQNDCEMAKHTLDAEKQWYVIQVVSGQEQATIELIRQLISSEYINDCFCPMRERRIKYQGTWKMITEKLFPGYIFVVTTQPELVFFQLKKIPKFTRLLGNEEKYFIPLSIEETKFIQKFGDEEHVAHVSQVEVEEGNKVRIISGELVGYEGQIVKINLHKRIAIIRTEFMGSSVDVHLGIEIVEKLN